MAFLKKYGSIILLISLLSSWTNRTEAQSGGGPLAINKQVSRSKVSVGDTLTYTLILSNSGTVPATNLVVKDSSSVGLRYISGSASIPTGSNFTPGMPISSWQIPSVGAGQSLTLTFRSVADSSGIFYNQATIPGDTAKTCTTVPIKVCAGDDFLFRLTVPAGRSSYRWFRNGIELAGQTTNLLEITTPGSYSVSVDDVTGKCPDFSQCPFIIEEDPLPTFQAQAIPATCNTNTIQANGQIVLTNFNPAYTYQYSAGPSFNPGLPLSGNPQPIPSTGILANNLPSPVASTPYTIRVYNTAGCYTDQTVTLQPATCCMTAVVSAGSCQTATNTYTSTVIITLSNPTTGTLTVTDGPVIRTLATTSGTSSLTAVFANLPSDASTHTITVSLPGCSSLTSTYTAPASCTTSGANTAPVAANAIPPQSATVGQNFSFTIPANTFTDAETSAALILAISGLPSGLSFVSPVTISGTPATTLNSPLTITVTATDPGSLSTSTSFLLTIYPAPLTNPANFTITNVTTLTCITLSATERQIRFMPLYTGTNGSPVTFSVLNELAATTDTGPYTLNLYTDNPVVQLQADQAGSVAQFSYNWLYACNTTPENSGKQLSVSANPGACNPATNQYALSGTISLTGTEAGTLVIVDANSTTTVSVSANQTSVDFSLSGLPSGTGPHTITVTGSGYVPTSFTYTSPASCTNTQTCQLGLTITPGVCNWVDNKYELTGTITIDNTLVNQSVIVKDGNVEMSVLVIGHGPTSFTLTGLNSDAAIHTVVASAILCGLTSATYAAPASCEVTIALSASDPGACQPATNQYATTGTISLTNAVAGTATVTDGALSTTVAVSAGATSIPYALSGLSSGTGSHTITVSYGSKIASTTYTAPASCTSIQACVAPTFSARAIGVTCIGNVLQSNGQIILSDFNPAYTYQYSAGASFDPAASLSGAAQSIPPGGLIVNNLANPATDQLYTVRVYNELGCSTDVTVILRSTVCGCPPDQCVPFVITQTHRGKRIGD
jgi:uncharacterized repeat protein (TIGR01451 family)